MKLMIITPHIPYPLNSGGNNAQYLMIDYLRLKMDITLVCLYGELTNVNILKSMWPNVEIHIIDMLDNTSLPKNITIKKIKRYLKDNSKIVRWGLKSVKLRSLIHKCKADKNENFPDKRKMMFRSLRFELEESVVNYVLDLNKNRKYDIVQVEFIRLLSLGIILPKEVKKVFVHHEIGFIRTEREQSTLTNVDPFDHYLYLIQKKQEIDYLKNYDSIITFSNVDKELLSKYLDKEKIFISQFAVKMNNFIENYSFKFHDLLYLGGEGHYPNKDAIEWFISNVFTEISYKYSEMKMKIIGDWSNSTILKHQSNSKIEFCGYIDDLFASAKNCVLIVPLRIGSGIRAKILDAFSLGIPVISSSIGIEGIPAVNGVHFFQADDPDEYLNAINILFTNPQRALELTLNAYRDIVPLFSIEHCGKIRYQCY